MATFGERLKFLRLEKDITLEDLSKDIHITKATLSRYENSKRIPNIDIAQKIADYFNVSTDYIYGKTNFKNYDGMTREVGVKSIEQVENEKLERKVRKLLESLSEIEITLIEEIKKENFSIKDLYEILKTVKAVQQSNNDK